MVGDGRVEHRREGERVERLGDGEKTDIFPKLNMRAKSF